MPSRAGEYGAPCSVANLHPGGIAGDELVPGLGDDGGLGGFAGVIGGDNERDHLVPPASMADLALVVVQPRLVVDGLAGGPLGCVGAAGPARGRGVRAYD